MITWLWSYVTFKRGARLITGGYAPGAESVFEPRDIAHIRGQAERNLDSKSI